MPNYSSTRSYVFIILLCTKNDTILNKKPEMFCFFFFSEGLKRSFSKDLCSVDLRSEKSLF